MDEEKKTEMSENETEHPTQDTGDSAPDASAVAGNGVGKVPKVPKVPIAPKKPDVSNIPNDERKRPRKDTYLKKVLQNPHYCADFLNQNMFDGEKRVSYDEIRYLSKEISYISPETLDITTRMPDVSTLAVVHDGDRESTCFLIFILEGQSVVDYSMAARLMVETGIIYLNQYEEYRSKEYDAEYKKWENCPDPDDKTPEPRQKHGAREGDRLFGVVPIVFYQDSGSWTAPLDIHNQLREDNKGYKYLIPNFFYHVITPSSIDDEKLDGYKTALGKAIKVIKHSNSWDIIYNMLKTDAAYKDMEQTLFQFGMASVFPSISVDAYDAENDEGGYDMCEAMEQGFEMLYGDRLRKEVDQAKAQAAHEVEQAKAQAAAQTAQEVAQSRKDTMSLVRQVRSELKKNTPKEGICSKLGVDMSFVEDCM